MALGGTTVGELLQRMSAAEFTYWQAFYAQCPFGPDVTEVLHAQTAAAVVAVHSKKRVGVQQFLLRRPRRQQQRATAQQIHHKLLAWAAWYDASERAKGKG